MNTKSRKLVMTLRNREKGFFDITLILAVVAVIAVGGFVAWKVMSADEITGNVDDVQLADGESSDTAESKSDVEEGYKRYESELLNFGFVYPEDWGEVTEEKTFAVTDNELIETGDFYQLNFNTDIDMNKEIVVELFSEDWELVNWGRDRYSKRLYPDYTGDNTLSSLLQSNGSYKEHSDLASLYEDSDTKVGAAIDRFSSGVYLISIQSVETSVSEGVQIRSLIVPDPDPYPDFDTNPETLFVDQEIEEFTKFSNSFYSLVE